MLDWVCYVFSKDKEYDFLYEVYEVMNGCLVCKVCVS